MKQQKNCYEKRRKKNNGTQHFTAGKNFLIRDRARVQLPGRLHFCPGSEYNIRCKAKRKLTGAGRRILTAGADRKKSLLSKYAIPNQEGKGRG